MKKENPKIWLWSDWRDSLPHNVFADKNIEGVNLAAYWSDLEPERGKLNLKRIVEDLKMLELTGKKTGLSIAAGAKSPTWLKVAAYERGELLKFTEVKKDGKAHLYSFELPNPLKHSYVNAYREFIEALSTSLVKEDLAHSLQTLAISGGNITTCEWRLPHQTPIKMGREDVTDALNIWKSVGYYPESVVNLYNDCRRILVRNFPTAKLCTDLCSGNEFPELGDLRLNVNTELIRAAKNTSYPRRYYFKHTSLTPSNTGKLVREIKEAGFFCIWQTNRTFFESAEATDKHFLLSVNNARVNEVDRIELQPEVYMKFKHLLP